MNNRLLTIWIIAILFVGCSKAPFEQNDTRTALKVEVVTTESEWSTRGASSAAPHLEQCDTVYVDDDIFITAEVEDLAAVLSREQAERALQFAADSLALLSSTSADIPATRGTPATTTSQIASLMMNMYVSGTGDFVATTPLKSSFTGTLNGGNYTLSPEYAWLESLPDKHSFLTFAPNASSSNGITMAADGRTVTYVVPTTTANQPDLCWATPSLNNVNKPLQTVALSHKLTAIGVGFKGYDVRIKSATIKGVKNNSTLNLQTGVWSALGGSGDYSFGVSAAYRKDTHTAGFTNATAANGYLMMIPQTLSGTETLEIEYEGQNGQPSGKLPSIKLSEILTTWAAGKRVMYNIRLKTAPAVSSGDLTINDFRAGYTTSSPLTISAATDDNLTFTWSEAWLKIHKGSATTGTQPSGAVSGWSTGVNGWGTSIWFFTTDNNPSTTSARTATVTVTGKKSGTKTFKVTQVVQPKPTLSLSQTNPGVTIPAAGADYYVNVTSNSTWKAVGTNCTVTPTGSGNVNSFKITVQANTGVQRTPQVVFETTNTTAGVTNAKVTWSGTQAAFAPTISLSATSPGANIPVGGSEYSVTVTSNTTWKVVATNCTTTISGNTVKIKVAANTGAQRTVKVDFTTTSTVTGATNVTKTWSGTQAVFVPTISFSPTSPAYVPYTGGSYTVKVTSNYAWTATGTNVSSVSPNNGAAGTTDVVIKIETNPTRNATRVTSVTFATNAVSGVTAATDKWSTKQALANSVWIDNMFWAVGNIVGTASGSGPGGLGSCDVGASTDCGLYFQWGSLVGWCGGTEWSGRGLPKEIPFLYKTFAWIWPNGYTPSMIQDWKGDPNFDDPLSGVGDPCKYYLGGTWRLPTRDEHKALVNAGKGAWINYGGVNGRWLGKSPGNPSSSVFFPASGQKYIRTSTNPGSIISIGLDGYYWNSTISTAEGQAGCLNINDYWAEPNYSQLRAEGQPVRCVSE